MRWRWAGNRWTIFAAFVVASAGLGGLVVYLWHLGLDQADQLASVVGMFIGLVSLTVAVLAIAQTRQPAKRPGGRAAHRITHQTAWGPRPLSEEVRQLLTAIHGAADTLPNPLLGDRRTAVSTVYVRQRVEQPRPRTMRDRKEERKRLFLPFDHEPLTIPSRQPFAKAFELHRHLLIEGGPGTGKSTTARQICRELAAAWLKGDPAPAGTGSQPLLPLLISARGLAGHIGLRWPEAIANAARAELGAVARLEVPYELLEGPVDGVPWLVVIDGLDEVPGDERDALLDQLAAQTQNPDPAFRLLITTRPLAGHATSVLGSITVGHYTLVPFDAAALREFARRWFTDEQDVVDEDEAGRFLNEIAAAGLQEVTSVPLMATMAISVFTEGGADPLPRNRYDLYENFLSLLRRTNHRRRVDARTELAEALSSEPEGAKTAHGLYDHLEDLLETLAIARVSSRKPLLPAALERLHRLSLPLASPPPLDWAKRVMDALIATGLVQQRDGSIDFIHLSFAEHLAARVHARELNGDFKPDDQRWQRWLGLLGHRDQDAALVLAGWSRRHQAGPLLDWLLRGLHGHRMLAVQLVAEGTPANSAQVAGCLNAVGAELALNRQHGSPRAVSLLRRFPADTQLLGWLRDQLYLATGYPFQEVALAHVAAERSARLRPEMIERIRSVLSSATMMRHRLEAAKALHQIAGGRSDHALSSLRAVLRDPAVDESDGVDVGVALMEFDGEPRSDATEYLTRFMRDHHADYRVRRQASEALVRADGSFRSEALERLQSMLGVPRYNPDLIANVAETVIAIAPETADEMAARVWEVFLDPMQIAHETDAFRVLESLSGENRKRLVAALLRRSASPLLEIWDRHQMAIFLAGLGDEAGDAAVEVVVDVVQQSWTDTDDAMPMTVYARDSEPEFRGKLVQLLSTRAEDRALPRTARVGLALSLARLDPRFRTEVRRAVDEIMEPPLPYWTAYRIRESIQLLHPDDADAVVAPFCDLLVDQQVDHPDAVGQLDLLAVVVPELAGLADQLIATASEAEPWFADRFFGSVRGRHLHAAPLVSGVVEVVRNQRLPEARRMIAARSLWFSGVQGPEVSDALVSFADDDTLSAASSLNAVNNLPNRVKGGTETAMSRLGALRDNETLPPSVRVSLLSALLDRSREQAPSALAEMRMIARSPYLAISVRSAAWQIVADSEEHFAEAIAGLTALQATPYATLAERCRIVDALVRMIPPHGRSDLVETISAIATECLDLFDPDDVVELTRLMARLCPDRMITSAQWAAAVVDGSQYTDIYRIAGHLAEPPSGSIPADLDRLPSTPAGWTEMLRREWVARAVPVAQRSSIAAKLREWVAAPGLLPDQRFEVVVRLSKYDFSDRSYAVELLRKAMDGGLAGATWPAIDPMSAAAELYREYLTERPAAGAFLRSVAGDAAEPVIRRSRARALLVGSGGPAARRFLVPLLKLEIDRPEADVATRCAAARNLAEIRPGDAADLFAKLRSLLTTARASDRLRIAQTIVGMDTTDQAAVRALCDLILDPHIRRPIGAKAAAVLAAGAIQHRATLARVTRQRLASVPSPHDAVWLHEALADVVPATVADAAAALTGLATAGPLTARLEAARALLGFGEAATSGQNVLVGILTDLDAPGHLRVKAGRYLAGRPGPYDEVVREHLIHLPGNGPYRIEAALVVMEYAGPTRDRAAASLRRFVSEPHVTPYVRFVVAEALADHDDSDSQDCARAIVAELSRAEDVQPALRYQAVAFIGRLDPTRAEEVIADLRDVLSADSAHMDHRRWAAEALASLSDTLRRPALDALRALRTMDMTDRERRRLERSIAEVSG
ncbi:NACHT domain-containing protein [Actinoplanes sp. LDG1-06]|uniref:NACHT domain-containing protein n=1 Tax=Paractinoplanes ovalisporus TaxID=2810368 RepID=A0ABS2AJR2_9ACTN|nr:NACHT domain-containing protein [Actinoplanes ovalisporus]MBM2620041.1 NACHT domain-containing protein [Actinoplanes ovalisporus]